MKAEIRNDYLLVRKGLSDERRQEANQKVFEELLKLVGENQKVLSYYPLGHEVSVHAFNQKLAEENRLSLPRIESDNLVPCSVRDMEKELKTFSHTFMEPDFSCPITESIDLVIVPGVVFDKNGGRIGFGKGHYDKFLEKRKIPTIGLLFKEQLFDGTLPLEKHDITMEKLCIV